MKAATLAKVAPGPPASEDTTASHEQRVADPGSSGLAFLAGSFFSFRMFIMLLSVRLLGMEPQAGTGVSLALNFLLLLLVAFDSLGGGASVRQLLRLPPVRWVGLFLAFSFASLTWTVAVSRVAAAGYCFAMAADVGIVVLLLQRRSPVRTMQSLLEGYVWGAVLLAIVAWLLPGQSDLRLGDEELLGTNQIGYLCGFACFMAQYLARQKVGRYSVAAAFLAITMLRSLSKTTIVAFVVAETFLLLRDTSVSRRTKLSMVAAALLVCALFSNLLLSYFDLYSATGSNPETLTGRIGIWAYIFEEAIAMPWIGHGFYSVWKVIPPFGPFEARHAHNELLQQFYLFGAAGIVLMLGLYGSLFRHTRRVLQGSRRTFFITLLIFVLVRGLADTEYYDLSLPLWSIVMFSALHVADEMQR